MAVSEVSPPVSLVSTPVSDVSFPPPVSAVSVLPVSSNSADDPVEVIASEKVTVRATVPPALYEPAVVDDVTVLTVGAA